MELSECVLAMPLVFPKSWLACYHRLGLSAEEMIVYLQLYANREEERARVDMTRLARDMGLKKIDLFQLIQQLMDLGVISLKTEKLGDGRQSDYYDISPFVEKVVDLIEKDRAKIVEEEGQALLREIEQQMRRPLTAKDIELVKEWIKVNRYPIEMLRLALRETVVNQANNLAYMDRILLNWEEKGLYRAEDIQRHLSIKNPLQDMDPKPNKTYPKVPLTKWLS